jgi:hypothetical protein
VVTQIAKEKNCIMHSGRDIILFPSKKLTSIFGVTVDDKQASTKAKFPRKKYMGM